MAMAEEATRVEAPAPAEAEEDVVAHTIVTRRTIHEFRPEPVPPKLIRKALELARWAPNHHLTEPWRFYLLGPETAEAIARLNAELVTASQGAAAGEAKYERWRHIPGWLVVTCAVSDDEVRAREDYAACCCAIHNFSLFLWGRGVGVKWTTGAVTREPAFHDLVWIDPEVERVVGLVWYGWPAEVPHLERRALEEVSVVLP